MRHLMASGCVLAALVALRVAAEDSPRSPPTADPHPAEQAPGADIKGYGYGEQPGKSRTAAKQETGDRAASTAPQDERRDGPAARAHGSATGAEPRSITGQVVEVGPTRVSVRSADRRVHRLRLDASTRVVRDGAEVPVRTLQPGDEIQAAYDTRGGRRVATRITSVERGAREPPSQGDEARESERRQEGARPRAR